MRTVPPMSVLSAVSTLAAILGDSTLIERGKEQNKEQKTHKGKQTEQRTQTNKMTWSEQPTTGSRKTSRFLFLFL
jgi:hypothetical protein